MTSDAGKIDKSSSSSRQWADLNRRVLFGRSNGQILWQPRIGCWYDDRKFFGTPFAKETGLDGIEAITPKPQGDVTLEEIKEALGEKLFLIDGIPAVYFDDTYPVDVLKDCVRHVVDLFAPKLVLGASDEISSTADISRIPIVGKIVDEYNASCHSSVA